MFKKIIAAVVISFMFILGAIGLRVNAIGLPYGGFVTFSFYCSCSNTWLLILGPPSAGQYVYDYTAILYPNYMIPLAGVWHLGLYRPGAICLVYVGKGCATFGAAGKTITLVGTSL